MRVTALLGILLLAQLGCSASPDAGSTSNTTGDTTARTSTLDGKLQVPSGLKVTYYSADVPGVRFMAIGTDGAVYASSQARDRSFVFPMTIMMARPIRSWSSRRG